MVSQCTKYEVSRFTRYEAVNGGAKCRKSGGWGGQGALKVNGNVAIRQSATFSYSTLIETMRLSCTVFEIQPAIGQKSPILTHPTCIRRPRRGVTPVEFCGDLWRQKTRVPGLSCGVVCVILRLAVLVEHRLVTDGRTDGRTQGHGQYRGCIASRGKNWGILKNGTSFWNCVPNSGLYHGKSIVLSTELVDIRAC